MKLSVIAAATLSLAALAATSALAQDNMMKKPMVSNSMTTGKPMMMVPMNASTKDKFMAAWVYRNLDDREVKRYRASGFDDKTIKGAANIAMRTGVETDYILRLVRESGYALPNIAAMFSVPTNVVNSDIPGYGVESVSMMAPMKPMGGMMMK